MWSEAPATPSHCEIYPQTLRLSAIGFGNICHANKLIEIEEARRGMSTENRRGEEREGGGCAKSKEGEELPRDSPASLK